MDLGRPISCVSTYELGGRQYVAVAVGLTSKPWDAKGGGPRVVVLALPAAAARR